MKDKRIDWVITLLPLAIVIGLSFVFFFLPEQSNLVLSQIRFLLGDTLGSYYLLIGLGIFLFSIYIACSKYVNIVLEKKIFKPIYTFFDWVEIIFPAEIDANI